MIKNRILNVTILLLTTLLMASSGRAADDAGAIIQATTSYVKKETGVTDPLVTVEGIADGYARALVKSKSGETDPATVFLKKGKGKWKVLTLGTAFSPEDYTDLGIPASLQE